MQYASDMDGQYRELKGKNSIDHTLNCKLGGYVHMRHNKVRDVVGDLMREVCQDVKIELELLPLKRIIYA